MRSFKDIFLLLFPLTTFVVGALAYSLLHSLVFASVAGGGCGLVVGGMAGYYGRSFEFVFDFDPSINIYTQLQLLLLEMGYRLDNQFQRVITFAPTARAGLFSSHIRVEINTNSVKLEGARWHIHQLRDKLGV